MILKEHLFEFAIQHGLTPLSEDYKPACESYIRKTHPSITEAQKESVLNNFLQRTKNKWRKCRVTVSNYKDFIKKEAKYFSRPLVPPASAPPSNQESWTEDQVKVKSSFAIPYFNTQSLCSFADAKVVSSDGFGVKLNRQGFFLSDFSANQATHLPEI